MTNPKPAGFLLRLVAHLVEKSFSLTIVSFLMVYLSQQTSIPDLVNGILIALTVSIFLTILGMIYTVATTHYFGGDLGKLLTGLQVKNEDGSPLSFKKIIFRQLLAHRFSSLLFGLGYVSIIKDPQSKAWHDKTVNSNVFKVHNLLPLSVIVLILVSIISGFLLKTSISNFAKSPIKDEVFVWTHAFEESYSQEDKKETTPLENVPSGEYY